MEPVVTEEWKRSGGWTDWLNWIKEHMDDVQKERWMHKKKEEVLQRLLAWLSNHTPR